MSERDYALTTDPDGTLLLHAADCPLARRLADEGQPVMTMLGCVQEPPDDLKRHGCLKPKT